VAPQPPKELFINAKDNDPRLPSDFREQYAKAPDTPPAADGPVLRSKTALRNQFVRTLLSKINTEYFKFTNDLFVGRSSIGFAGDLSTLGLTAAGAVVGGEDVKSILSATATAVTGANSSFEKRFFQEQAVEALLTTMDASRLAVLETLETNLKKPASEYTLDDALLDVQSYHRAGTLLSALTAIQNSQGAQAKQSQSNIQAIKGLTPTITSLSLASAAPGESLTISGANFGDTQGNSKVLFGSTPATVASWSSNSIAVTVPNVSGNADVTVVVGGVSSPARHFTSSSH
jgi:hypothetical protein